MARHISAALLACIPLVHAFWRMPCGNPLVSDRLDPIVNPGNASSHVHRIHGGNAFAPSMTYDTTQTSTCTTCQVKNDLSNYWVPTLYYKDRDGKFTAVQNNGLTVYYQQRTSRNEPIKAFPPGFRVLAGNTYKRSASSDPAGQAVSFVCLHGPGEQSSRSAGLPTSPCPWGLRAQIYFPSCWNGQLDSADHKSHMSYPIGHYDNGYCPGTHPIHLVSIFYEATFATNQFPWWDSDYGTEQPFIFSTGDATGYGFHADFVNGWPEALLQNAIDVCTNNSGRMEDCPAFAGRMYTTEETASLQCNIPKVIAEDYNGPLFKLPGCNNVTAGPQNASPDPSCPATVLSGPQLQFTDVTSLGWAFQGCAVDKTSSRSMSGYSNIYSSDQGTMTVSVCVKTCGAKGFKYAGLEFYGQCFCSNTFPASRLPRPGTVGQCNLPCKGDAEQFCGGSSQLSLYKACEDASCTNSGYVGPGGSDAGNTGEGPTSSAESPSGPTIGPASSSASSSKTSRTNPRTTRSASGRKTKKRHSTKHGVKKPAKKPAGKPARKPAGKPAKKSARKAHVANHIGRPKKPHNKL